MGKTTNGLSAEVGAEQRGGSTSCKATAKGGQPCGAPAMKGGDYCFMHSPATATERRAAARRGGLRTAQKRSALLGQIDFGSAEGVRSFLEGLTSAALTDAIPSSKAKDVATIASAALGVRSGAETDEKLGKMEAALVALKDQMRKAGIGGG